VRIRLKTYAPYLGIAVLAAAIGYAAWAQLIAGKKPRYLEARVVMAYPHDPQAFTQGLVFHDGKLYESTGQYGASSLRRVRPETGIVEQIRSLNRVYFGEGIAILDDKIYQLTWQNGVAIVYDLATFDLLETFIYDGEGWGLTDDGRNLILSDGSATLKFLDPKNFEVLRTIDVRSDAGPVDRLNELEFIDDEIWANIWYEDRIARIAPETGEVIGWIDVSDLYPQSRRRREDVANGIAYDEKTDRLFVTGKNWPQLFEIELVGSSRP
jgi:glutamine cyclotransferase